MGDFGAILTVLSFVIGLLAIALTWQGIKNGKIMKENFVGLKENFVGLKENFVGLKENFVSIKELIVRMDERTMKMDEKAEQRHIEVIQLMKQQTELLEKGFGTIIRDINEIKTK